MYLLAGIAVALIYITCVTVLSYKLGMNKTENAKRAAIIGFLLSFIPPLALIYIAVLLLKQDSDIV